MNGLEEKAEQSDHYPSGPMAAIERVGCATEAARIACHRWKAPAETLSETHPAPLLIDALFGTGLTRALDSAIAEPFNRLAALASRCAAIDIPSGIGTDDGATYCEVPQFDLTVALVCSNPRTQTRYAAKWCWATLALSKSRDRSLRSNLSNSLRHQPNSDRTSQPRRRLASDPFGINLGHQRVHRYPARFRRRLQHVPE
jgi:hypothetical protein